MKINNITAKKQPPGKVNLETSQFVCGMYWNRTSDLMPVKHAL